MGAWVCASWKKEGRFYSEVCVRSCEDTHHSVVVVGACVHRERSCYYVDRRCVLEAVKTKRVGGRWSLDMIPQCSELKGQRTFCNMIITNVLVQHRLRSHTILLCLKWYCLWLPNAWAEEQFVWLNDLNWMNLPWWMYTPRRKLSVIGRGGVTVSIITEPEDKLYKITFFKWQRFGDNRYCSPPSPYDLIFFSVCKLTTVGRLLKNEILYSLSSGSMTTDTVPLPSSYD